MDDLTESIDDLICAFDQHFFDMDKVAFLVFVAVLIAAFAIFSICALLKAFRSRHNKKVKRDEGLDEPKTNVANLANVVVHPNVHKRTCRISPGKDLIGAMPGQKSKHAFVVAPQCVGSDLISVLWANDLFCWIWNDLFLIQELIQIWIHNLNSIMSKLINEQGVEVQLIRVLPESPAPILDNVTCECNSNDDVMISCDCDANPSFQLKCSRKCGDKIEHSHYRVNVTKFLGRLDICCETQKSKLNVKFAGWPEIKISLSAVGSIFKANAALDEAQLQEVISEILLAAFRTTEQNFDLSTYKNCPKLIRNLTLPQSSQELNHANVMSSTRIQCDLKKINNQKRLLIKIERAINLNENCQKPFCVIELDEPLQKNQTTDKHGETSPVWDQLFLFDVTNKSSEVLFEVYDRASNPPTFLGLSIIGVDDLLTKKLKKHTITLQDKPFEKNNINASLVIETAVIETDDIPFILNDSEQLNELMSTLPRTPSDNDIGLSTTNFNGAKFTESNMAALMIHNIEREPLTKREDEYLESQIRNTEVSSLDNRHSRSRRRSFFGTIKRKLQKTKDERSKSVQSYGSKHESGICDMDDKSSRKSSVSLESGYSGVSSKTYLGEDSTLILEISENGSKTYYLMPFGAPDKLKNKKKSTKLHICNDHIFVAKHVFGNITCSICGKTIKLRFGKQGYECRDCLLKCHKLCHAKVPTKCPKSTINTYTVKLLSD